MLETTQDSEPDVLPTRLIAMWVDYPSLYFVTDPPFCKPITNKLTPFGELIYRSSWKMFNSKEFADKLFGLEDPFAIDENGSELEIPDLDNNNIYIRVTQPMPINLLKETCVVIKQAQFIKKQKEVSLYELLFESLFDIPE